MPLFTFDVYSVSDLTRKDLFMLVPFGMSLSFPENWRCDSSGECLLCKHEALNSNHSPTPHPKKCILSFIELFIISQHKKIFQALSLPSLSLSLSYTHAHTHTHRLNKDDFSKPYELSCTFFL
jgi:hypothetical protein